MLDIFIYCTFVLLMLFQFYFYSPNANFSLVTHLVRRVWHSLPTIKCSIIDSVYENWNDLKANIKIENYNQVFNVVIGVDFTASNEYRTNLHRVKNGNSLNPYQKTLKHIEHSLTQLTKMSIISDFKLSVYGFGDSSTKNHSVFNFFENSNYAFQFRDILIKYNERVKEVYMSGPTSYSPLLSKTIETIKSQANKTFTILFILTDDGLNANDFASQMHLIRYASSFPLSVIFVHMRDTARFDYKSNLLDNRLFDNLTQIDFSELIALSSGGGKPSASDRFGLSAFAKLPEQLNYARKLHLI